MRITATIITIDEERNIARAIESLRCCDEILIVDSGSVDRTVELAEKLGARVIEAGWLGFAAQKNRAAEQASHDWILSLDADEAIGEALEAEIWNLKKSGPQYDAYTMPRMARYLGRWILHSGWYPDYKLRLFNRRSGTWEGAYVHESVEVSGRIATLPGEILHYTCNSLDEHRARIEFYTDLAAKEMFERGESVSLLGRTLGPPWVFLNTYVFRLGMLDGWPGYLIAKMAARYVRRKYTKLANLQKAACAQR